MIQELQQADFYLCKSIFHKDGQLEIKAVIEGISPGRIFVDNIISPKTGLVWLGNNDGFCFIGDETNKEFTNHIQSLVQHVIIPEANKVELKYFECFGDHENWNDVIEEVFEDKNIKSWGQRVYTLNKFSNVSLLDTKLEEGYNIVEITESLLDNENGYIKNIEFIRDIIVEFWGTYKAFFKNGYGYCCIYNDIVVSCCYSGFVIGNTHCVGIETLEAHRGRKLAQSVTATYLNEGYKRHYNFYWDCMDSNVASIAVAERLGFKHKANYTGHYFKL